MAPPRGPSSESSTMKSCTSSRPPVKRAGHGGVKRGVRVCMEETDGGPSSVWVHYEGVHQQPLACKGRKAWMLVCMLV